MRLIAWWMFGFAISVGLGMLLTPWLLSRIRSYITQKAEHRGEVIDEEVIEKTHLASLYVPGWLVGITERVFFTILVAFDVSSTATAMIGWITIKMLTDWHRILKPDEKPWVRSLAFSALLGNMISLLFALIGGLICRLGRF